MDVSGGVVPGSLLSAANAAGDVGRWTAAPSINLLDPTEANTIESIVSAFNQLVWQLAQSRLLMTEPLLWWGSESKDGVIIDVRNTQIKPHVDTRWDFKPAENTTMRIRDFVDLFNSNFSEGVRMTYAAGQLMLVVHEGFSIYFGESSDTTIGSGRRLLNRIFNGTFPLVRTRDISDKMKQYSINQYCYGPTLIQGIPYGAPYRDNQSEQPPSVHDIKQLSISSASASLSWTSPVLETPNYKYQGSGVAYYVKVTADGFEKIIPASAEGVDITELNADTEYSVTVITEGDYGINADYPPITVKTEKAVTPLPPNFAIYQQDVTPNSITVGWDIPIRTSTIGLMITLLCQQKLDESKFVVVTAQYNNGFCLFENLPAADTDYIITATLSNGKDTYTTEPITVRTALPPPPALPPNFTLNPGRINIDSVTVTWDVPEEPAGLSVQLSGFYSYAFTNYNLPAAIAPLSQGYYIFANLPFPNWVYTIKGSVTNGVDTSSPPYSIDMSTVELPTPALSYDPDSVTDTSFTLTWNPPLDTDLIPKIVITLTTPGVIISTKEYDSALRNITINDLTPNTYYTPNASFKTKSGSTGNGFAISIKTQASNTSNVPDSFILSDVGDTGYTHIRVGWGFDSPDLTGITIQFTSPLEFSLPASSGNFNFTGLNPGQTYTFTATLTDGVKTSAPASINIQTDVLEAPSISIGEPTVDSIIVNFDMPSVTTDGPDSILYTIYDKDGVEIKQIYIPSLDQTRVIIDSLSPYTDYTVDATFCIGGQTIHGERSSPVPFKTLIPPVEALTISPNYITAAVSWESPQQINKYDIVIDIASADDQPIGSYTTASSVGLYIITNLSISTTYKCNVYFKNGGDTGAVQTIPINMPTSIPVPEITTITSGLTSIDVTINQPSNISDISKINVRLNNDKEINIPLPTVQTTPFTVTISELTPATNYIFTMAYILNDGTLGDYNIEQKQMTLIPPFDLTLVEPTGTSSITVKWTPIEKALVVFTSPFEQNIDSNLGEWVFDSLVSDTDYTITGYVTYVDGQSNTVTINTRTQKTIFGPIPDIGGVIGDNTIDLPPVFEFRVQPSSGWIGKQLNLIRFPAGVLTSTNASITVRIQDNPTTVADALTTIHIEDNPLWSNPNPVEGRFISNLSDNFITKTITETTNIIIGVATNSDACQCKTYSSDKLADILCYTYDGSWQPATYGICCEFDLVN